MSGNQNKDKAPTTLEGWKKACHRQEMRGNRHKKASEERKEKIEELEKKVAALTIEAKRVPLLEEQMKQAVRDAIRLMVYDKKKEEAEIEEEERNEAAEQQGRDDNNNEEDNGGDDGNNAEGGNDDKKKKSCRKDRLLSLINGTLKNSAIAEGHILFRGFKYMNFATMAHLDVLLSIFKRSGYNEENDAVEMLRLVEPLKQYMGRRYSDMKRTTKNSIKASFLGK